MILEAAFKQTVAKDKNNFFTAQIWKNQLCIKIKNKIEKTTDLKRPKQMKLQYQI